MADVIVVPKQPGYDQVFKSRDGVVGRDLSRRAIRVQLGAKRQVGVQTGLLKRSIHKSWFTGRDDDLGIRVGSDVDYSYMHHEGTQPHVIRPRNARALRWVADNGDVVFARSVQHPGTAPNRYLSDNLPLAVR